MAWFWYMGDFIHTALFMRLVRARFAAAFIPYQGLDEQTVLLLTFTLTSLPPFYYTHALNEMWMTRQL
jgi:hypothetical protein